MPPKPQPDRDPAASDAVDPTAPDPDPAPFIEVAKLLLAARAGRNEHGWFWETAKLREADLAAERALSQSAKSALAEKWARSPYFQPRPD